MSAMPPPVPRPAHIPDEAQFEFNIYDTSLEDDPHRLLVERMQDAPAVFWTPHNGGHWMTTRYEESFEVLNTPKIYSSELISEAEHEAMAAMMPAELGRVPVLVPVVSDDPVHMRYRIPLQESFSP